MVELGGDHRPATVYLTHQVDVRYPNIVVVGARCWPSTHRDDGRPREAREVGRHDQQRDALVLTCLGIGPTGQPDVVGLVGPTGVDLGSVDHPFVAVADGLGPQRGQIGARRRFRVADGENHLTGEDAREEALLLIVASKLNQGRSDRVEGHERHGAVGPLCLVEQDELVGGRPASPAVLGWPAEAEHPVRSESSDDRSPDRGRLVAALQRVPDLVGHQLGEVGAQLGAQ